MDAVVARIDRDAAACDRDIAGRMNGVIRGCDVQHSGLNVEIAIFFLVGSDKAVVARVHCDGSLFNSKAVVRVNSVRLCCYRYCTACDDQVIIGGDSMSVLRVYRKAPGPVDRQIIVCENRAVCPVIQRLSTVGRTAGETVLTAFCQSQEHLVRLVDPDTGIVAAADLHAVQHDEYFGGVVGVHRDIAVCERTGDHIVTCICDHHISVDSISAVSGDRRPVSCQCDLCCAGSVPVSVLVVGGKVCRVRILLRVLINDLCDSQRLSIHEQPG